MRLGMLVSFFGDFGQKGFYNVQEIGLAKALDSLCDEVIIYKLTDAKELLVQEIEGCSHATMQLVPARNIGANGIVDVSKLDASLDALLYFSDTQLSLPYVSRWAKKNNIQLIPYIGVIESHSTNRIKRTVMDLLFRRNLAIYKKHHCIVKTPKVKEALSSLGVTNITVAPVGLDMSLMHKDFEQSDMVHLKQKYGFSAEDKVLLFVGRFTEEKRPMHMVKLFAEVHNVDMHYKLMMVGTGEQRDAVVSALKEQGLLAYTKLIERIPNKDIWELYRIADCFVNLNRQEIFGMAILEAMYYGCKVVAWEAPGPSFILENGVSGCLENSDGGMLTAILEAKIAPDAPIHRIQTHFTWEHTARKILAVASGE